MNLNDAQDMIRALYFNKDSQRGLEKTFIWFIEEVGELAEALRNGSEAEIKSEIADVFAWLISIANILNINLEEAFKSKYNSYCPRCKQNPCRCPI
jgi:NTP pyrophosphatase (non-canonical NTP hydrolase)